MPEKTDVSIWNNFLSGDDQAYEYIYKQHVQKLFLYGVSLTQDEALVKDCIQDVFMYLYRNRKHLGKTSNIRLYLISALRNTIFNSFRKQKTYNAFKDSIERESIDYNNAIEEIIGIEDDLERTALVNSLWAVLTGRQKEICYYKFVEGLSLEEISERIHIDYHSVANIIHRALKKMRKFYYQK